MRERIATSLAILLGLGILAWAIQRDGPKKTAEPQQTVWRMLDAAKNRDLPAYFSCFGGELEQRLRSLGDDMGEDGFGRYLALSADELKGVALFDVATGDDEAQLTVELVYKSETERQSLALRRDRSGWKIVAATSGTRRRSLIPHGMPIEEVD